jgi:hypothetical protein
MGFRNGIGALVLVVCVGALLPATDATSSGLPSSVLKALAGVESDYCDQFSGDLKNNCRQTFRANLTWNRLKLTSSGQKGILVESRNMGECGSLGCDLFLFVVQPDGRAVQVLGPHGDTGSLEDIKVLNSVTKDHYDIQKMSADGEAYTTYRWNGRRYSQR